MSYHNTFVINDSSMHKKILYTLLLVFSKKLSRMSKWIYVKKSLLLINYWSVSNFILY